MLPFLQNIINASPADQLRERLRYTAFDELMLIRLREDSYESQYHADGKFFTPVLNGSYQQLVEYSSVHMVHPEDRALHLRLMDPGTMEQRLKESERSGILVDDIRYLAMDGNWRRMQHVLIGGAEYGLPEGCVSFYLYDVQEMTDREKGQHTENAAATERMRRLMPDLIPETTFLALCDETLSRDRGQWCMIAVDVKHFKLFRELNGQDKAEKLLIRFGEIVLQEAENLGGFACYRGQDDFGLCIPFDKNRIEALFSRLRGEIDSLTSTSGFFPIAGPSSFITSSAAAG